MSVQTTLPTLSERTAAVFGLPFFPGGDLRRNLPPAVVEALQKIAGQIDSDILAVLFSASSPESMAQTFEKLFPIFRDYYVSMMLIMWGSLGEDAELYLRLTGRTFSEAKELIQSKGSNWMGQDAALNAVHGLQTITRIAKAAAKRPVLHLDAGGAAAVEEWANSVVGYAFAFAAVVASLRMVDRGQDGSIRLDHLATLAQWSKSFAVRAFHLSKVIGLFAEPIAGHVLVLNDPEDDILAAAGIAEFVRGLEAEDLR